MEVKIGVQNVARELSIETEQSAEQIAAPVRAEHDHARVVIVGSLDDALPRRRPRDRDALRAQAGVRAVQVRLAPLGD